MDVVRSNFASLLPQIKDDIDASEFVSFDTEFSGLGQNRHHNLFDTLEERYKKVKDSCLNYAVLQVGLCFFYKNDDKDSGNKYKCKSYNFYTFPYKVNGVPRGVVSDKVFSFQPSAFHFLAGHSFDFNKWIKEGISYMTLDEESALMEALNENKESASQSNNTNNSTPNVPDEHKEFINQIREDLTGFFADHALDKLDLEPCSAYRRKLIYETIKSMRVDGIKTSTCLTSEHSSERYISITKISLEEKSKDEQNLLNEAVGFSKVVQHLIRSKKPIIGHNALIDIIHILRHFISPLPEELSDFKLMLSELMPAVFDTKLIAMDPRFKDIISCTALNDLYHTVQKEPFKNIQVDIVNKSKDEETKEASYHQAAYDAYITGISFLNMYYKLCQKSDLVNFNSPTLLQYQGRINMMHSFDFSCLDISRTQSISDRQNVYHLTFPSEWSSSDIHQLFSPYGAIQIGWINDTSAFVGIKDSSLAKDVEQNLKDSSDSNFKITPYLKYIQSQNNQQIERKRHSSGSGQGEKHSLTSRAQSLSSNKRIKVSS